MLKDEEAKKGQVVVKAVLKAERVKENRVFFLGNGGTRATITMPLLEAEQPLLPSFSKIQAVCWVREKRGGSSAHFMRAR